MVVRTVIVIWTIAGIVAIAGLVYINISVNALVQQAKTQLQAEGYQVQPGTGYIRADNTCLQTCTSSNLQR